LLHRFLATQSVELLQIEVSFGKGGDRFYGVAILYIEYKSRWDNILFFFWDFTDDLKRAFCQLDDSVSFGNDSGSGFFVDKEFSFFDLFPVFDQYLVYTDELVGFTVQIHIADADEFVSDVLLKEWVSVRSFDHIAVDF